MSDPVTHLWRTIDRMHEMRAEWRVSGKSLMGCEWRISRDVWDDLPAPRSYLRPVDSTRLMLDIPLVIDDSLPPRSIVLGVQSPG